MPDRRRHRGPHPSDDVLFGDPALPALRAAAGDLAWLLGRGYSDVSALKLVGDRHGLRERQRRAVLRAACSDAAKVRRARTRLGLGDLAGRDLAVDGFNCVITVEAALAGGVILVAQDGCLRDLASVHGSYRKVEETAVAADLLGELIAAARPASVLWYLDRPVSNSGRLRQLLAERASSRGWPWTIELPDSPDRELIADQTRVAATTDGGILDRCAAWVDLAATVITARVPTAWVVDLRDSA